MVSSDQWRWRKHHIVAGGIAFTSGYADVLSLHRWKCFCGMLTGNSIWFGRVLAGETGLHGPAFYFCIILVFFLGVSMHRWADRVWKHRGASVVGTAFGLVGTCVEIYLRLWGEKVMDFEVRKWFVLFYVPLFGVVNGASMDGRLGSATTMVTGHVTTLGKALANASVQEFSYVEKCKLIMSFIILVASISGALVGTLVLRKSFFDTNGLFLPVLPVLVVLLLFHDHLARPRKLKSLKRLMKKGNVEDGVVAASGGESFDDDSESLDDDSSDDEEHHIPADAGVSSSSSSSIIGAIGRPADLEARNIRAADGQSVEI